MARFHDPSQVTIFVAGAGVRGSGYPNAWNTVRVLRGMAGVNVVDLCSWLPESFRLWAIGKTGRLNALLDLSHLLLANGVSVLRLLTHGCGNGWLYVPYPSVFLLWLLSWLPRRWRPRCICDAYITMWDALYQDRQRGDGHGWLAAALLRIESRALRSAERVLVDTTANAEHVARLFGVSSKRIMPLPLVMDGEPIAPGVVDLPESGVIRVLFIGTFVPLQGAIIVAQAIDQLRERRDIEFVLIGDGQQAGEAEPWLRDHPRLTWIREWQSADALARHLAGADICLGVFGGPGKASRVLPFKVYLALAAGKAILTQADYSTPCTPPIPAETIRPTANALVDAIIALSADPQRRATLSQRARRYHRDHLGDAAVVRAWSKLLAGMPPL